MTSDMELVDYLASYNVRRLPTEDLQIELDFAKRERDLTDNPEYREYQTKRVGALMKEQNRRRILKEKVKATGLTVDVIRDLKARVNIEDIFSHHLGIFCHPTSPTRSVYACPAHPDKHPSGVIYVEDQQYHCFQCHAHGDCFDALMAFKGMTFIQAVDTVAGYLGIELPKHKTAGKGCVKL